MDLKSFLKAMKLNESIISMAFGALVVLILVFVGYKYLRSNNSGSTLPPATTQTQNTPTSQEGKVPTNLPEKVKVEKGGTLWRIAEKFYGSGFNWIDIAKANNINNPSTIEVGQELKLPQVEAKKSTEEVAVATKSPTPPASLTSPTLTSTTSVNPTLSPTPSSPQAIQTETYTVVRGDNLWKIAVRAYGDGFQWVKIWRANKAIVNNHPNLIYPGQTFTIPRQATK